MLFIEVSIAFLVSPPNRSFVALFVFKTISLTTSVVFLPPSLIVLDRPVKDSSVFLDKSLNTSTSLYSSCIKSATVLYFLAIVTSCPSISDILFDCSTTTWSKPNKLAVFGIAVTNQLLNPTQIPLIDFANLNQISFAFSPKVSKK